MIVRLPLVGYSIGALGVRSLIDTSSWLMTCEGEVILVGFEGWDLGSLDKGSVLLPGGKLEMSRRQMLRETPSAHTAR